MTCVSFSDQSLPGTTHLTIDEILKDKVSPSFPVWKKISYLRRIWKIRKFVHEQRPDIFHAHYASSYGLLGRLCNYHPFVISVWGSDVYEFPRKSWLTRGILKSNLGSADRICSTSHAMARETQRYTNKNILVTPFGIDIKEFKTIKRPKGNNRIIGTIKGLENKYGIDTLIKAFSLIHYRFPDVKLRIIGSGPGKRDYVELANRLGLSQEVEFKERISHEQVPTHLNEFDIFIALSRNESFGVAVVEAMGCGVPVVVSNVGGLPEVVTNEINGFCVEPDSPADAAAKIETLLNDDELRARFSKNGRNHVLEKYDWTQNATLMKRIYMDLIDEAST